MTICIAAECAFGEESAIVLCRDWQANQGTLITSDDANKFREITENGTLCSILLAGSPTRADDLLTVCEPSIRKYMRETDENDTDLHMDALLKDLRAVTRTVKLALIEHLLGMSLGMGFEEFKQRGAKDLRESHYEEVWLKINNLDLGAELLITLFDAEGTANIVRLDILGEPHWEHNYSTIGSGSSIARSFLCQVDFTDELTLGQCIYEVLRAKYASERSRDVGRGTSVDVVVGGDRGYSISDKGFKYYEKLLIPYKTPNVKWTDDFIQADTSDESIPDEPESSL